MKTKLKRLGFLLVVVGIFTAYGLPIVLAVGLHPALAPAVGWVVVAMMS